mmetsp:Transcript_14427/g.22027  ORF Transcript_14427/g.22027 Transcript_14427/m.22027 type:complete len:105 (-) Transcript_14427:322-636(-)
MFAIIATLVAVSAQETSTEQESQQEPRGYTIINKCEGEYTSYLVNMDDDDGDQTDYEVIPLNDSLAAMKPLSIVCDCDGSFVTCVGIRGCRKCCRTASIKLPDF